MSRTFAQIEGSLPYSRKLRQLNHKERWAYLCTHLSPLCGYLGLFRYPLSVWAEDAQLSRSEVESSVQRLIEVELVEYDFEDETVRIRDWFLKRNAPENASRMMSLAADFLGLDVPDAMLLASVAEFVAGSVKRAQKWKPDSSEWGKLREVFVPFLKTMQQNYEDNFHAVLSEQLDGHTRTVRAEIHSLMPSIQFYEDRLKHPSQAPCPHPADTVGAHETRRDGDLDEKRRDVKKTAHFSANSQNGDVEREVGCVDMQRMEGTETNRSAKVMPLDTTKRSGLALEARAARGGAHG